MVSEARLQALFWGGGCPEASRCAEEAWEALAERRLGHSLSTAPGNSCFCPNTGCEVGFQCPPGSGRACLEVSGTALLLWVLLRVLKTPGTPTAPPRNLRCAVELGGPFACQVLVASGGFLRCFCSKTSSAWPGLLSPGLLQHLSGGRVVVPGAGVCRHLAAHHLLEPLPGLGAGNSSAGSAVLQLCFQERKTQNSGLCLAPCPCPQAAGRRWWCGPRGRDPSLRTEPRVSLVPCWHRAPGMDPHPKSSALNFLLTLQPLVLQCIPGTWEQCGVCAPSEEQRARHPGTRALA